jgi:hypothetical protein
VQALVNDTLDYELAAKSEHLNEILFSETVFS